jgi:hypothetical protein
MNGSSTCIFQMVGGVMIDVTVNSSLTDAGVLYATTAAQFILTNTSLTNLNGGKVSGGFVLQNILSVIDINNCSFVGCRGANAGGALAFLNSTFFLIVGCSFINCSSGYYGGAITSSSTSTTTRTIQNCTFSGNSALQFFGLDIYDSSNLARSIYTKASMSGSKSDSSAPATYVLFMATQVCVCNVCVC